MKVAELLAAIEALDLRRSALALEQEEAGQRAKTDPTVRQLRQRHSAVGPAGSQEVEAVGPLYAKAGMAFVSGSATLPALATSGANKGGEAMECALEMAALMARL